MYCLLPNKKNYTYEYTRTVDKITHIVVHYTGNNGDTARNNLSYFHNNSAGASAHYFVDENEVCSSVPITYIAWHASNWDMNKKSVGVELCSRKDTKGKYYFKPETEKRAAEFIAGLMKSYKIPIDNVIRHYDVNGKNCPAPFVPSAEWERFKKIILSYYLDTAKTEVKKEEEPEMVYYEKIEQIPAGEMREVVQKLINRGTIKGNGAGLHLSEDMVRMFVFLNREEIIK